jgi:hypothetical protein
MGDEGKQAMSQGGGLDPPSYPGRSSQSLDAQEPQDGARDDGTIGGIVRHDPRHTARYWSLGHVLGHKWTLQSNGRISRSQRLTVTRFGPP